MVGKKKNRVVLAVICLLAAATALFLVWKAVFPKPAEGQKQLTVIVIHRDGSNRSFSLDTQEGYLGRALVEAGIVADDQGDYGLYIQTADGETADSAKQEWWCVTKGGEKVSTGADSTPIAQGEQYELTLTVGY